MLDFSTFSLSKCNIYCKKNFFEYRTKIVLFGYFWLKLEKATVLCFFYISTLKYLQTEFHPKIKFLKIRDQNCLNWVFWTGILKNVEFEISILHLEFVNMQKFIQKQKTFKVGTRNTLLRYFWAAF